MAMAASSDAQPLEVSGIVQKVSATQFTGMRFAADKGSNTRQAAGVQWLNYNAAHTLLSGQAAHWFRCQVTNADSIEQRIGFYNNGALYCTLYVVNDTDTLQLISGELAPARQLQFLHDCNYNSFAVPAGGTITVLGRIEYTSKRQQKFGYAFYNIGYYHRKLAGLFISQWGTSQYHSFVLGALAFAALFVGLIGIWFKNSSYRYYVLFLLGGFLFVAIKGDQYSYLGMLSQYAGKYRIVFSESLQFSFIAAYSMFVIHLLDLKRYPQLYQLGKWMTIAFFAYALGIGAYLLATHQLAVGIPLYIAARLVAYLLSITLLVAIVRKVKAPGKRFYIAGTVAFMFFSLLGFLRQDHPDGPLGLFSPVWYVQTGILAEAILFGLALGYQMFLVEKEKRTNYQSYIHQLEVNRDLMTSMNTRLEATIAERTAELDAQKEKQLRLEYNQQITQLEMQALRSQMNPHFIFNSLNSIRYQIHAGQYKNASDYLLRFSRLLRMLLENARRDTVSLTEELELTRLYLEIEGKRFGEQYRFSMDVDEEVDTDAIQLPPMLLQPYAENAVKHGLLHSTRPEKWVRLAVHETADGSIEILITDNGIGRQSSALLQQSNGLQHQSLGTQITLERMELFSQQHHCQLTAQLEDLTADGEAAGTRVRIVYQTTQHV